MQRPEGRLNLTPYMVQELNALNKNPDWWSSVMEKLAEGQTLQDLAVEFKVKGSVLRIWIANDEKREEDYQQAQDLRLELRRQKIDQEVYNAATTPDVKISETGKLRAAEMILNQKSQVNVTAEGGGKITIVHESS